jgi:hypothetical protein
MIEQTHAGRKSHYISASNQMFMHSQMYRVVLQEVSISIKHVGNVGAGRWCKDAPCVARHRVNVPHHAVHLLLEAVTDSRDMPEDLNRGHRQDKHSHNPSAHTCQGTPQPAAEHTALLLTSGGCCQAL